MRESEMMDKAQLFEQASKLINSTSMGTHLTFYDELSEDSYGCGCCSTGSTISEEDEVTTIDSMIAEHKEVIEKLEKAKLLLIEARK